MHLLGVAPGHVDRVAIAQVKAKEVLVDLVEERVKALAEVLGGEALLGNLGLPAQVLEVARKPLEVLGRVELAHVGHKGGALEGALLGAGHGQQAVLAELATLNKAVHGIGENVERAQVRGGNLELLEDVLAAAVLLLGLPGGKELQERAHAADGNAELQEPLGVVRAGEKLLRAVREHVGGSGHPALDERELLP